QFSVFLMHVFKFPCRKVISFHISMGSFNFFLQSVTFSSKARDHMFLLQILQPIIAFFRRVSSC
ncbi:hypothetical protein PMAYCL1PPCAC_25910, partial [Pristionchus mayeri]